MHHEAKKNCLKSHHSDMKTFCTLDYKQKIITTDTNALVQGYVKTDAKFLKTCYSNALKFLQRSLEQKNKWFMQLEKSIWKTS